MATEHVHEWRYMRGGECFECAICENIMPLEEAERRLSATERLSADNARMAADFIKMEEGYKWKYETSERERTWNLHEEFDALSSYAAALEGE